MAKTWTQKLEGHKPPKVEVLDKAWGGAPAGARMLIPSPQAVADYMAAVPSGETRSMAEMRADLARAHDAAIACPMTTAIFARIAAEAALERLMAGARIEAITPFWRVIDPASPLAKKLSCGTEYLSIQRGLEATVQPS